VESSDARFAHFSDDNGLPRYYGESASTTAFRGLLSVHSRYGLQRLLTSYEAFSRSASAHSLPPGPPLVLPAGAKVSRVGFPPTDRLCLQGTRNNEAERALRHWVIARRIGMGTRTPQGTRAFALLASVIETCRKRGLSPWPYLAEVIRQRRKGLPAPPLPMPTI